MSLEYVTICQKSKKKNMSRSQNFLEMNNLPPRTKKNNSTKLSTTFSSNRSPPFLSISLVLYPTPVLSPNPQTVPPRWIVEPTDVSVERNRHITLHCQAQGVPVPTIQWKKATGTVVVINHVCALKKKLLTALSRLSVSSQEANPATTRR